MKGEILNALAETPVNLDEHLEIEKGLMQNRLKAIKLVLSEYETDKKEPVGEEAAEEVVTNDARADEAPSNPGGQAAGAGGGAAASSDAQLVPQKKKLRGKQGLQTADEGAPENDASAEAPRTPQAPPPGAGSGDAPSPAASEGGDGETTVRRFVRHNGDAKQALRKYIATFLNSEANELGKAPPCRSYRNLRVLADVAAEMEGEIKTVMVPAQFAVVHKKNKAFKMAYIDLMNMAKQHSTATIKL